MTEVSTVMTLDDVVNFSRVYEPWYAVVNRAKGSS